MYVAKISSHASEVGQEDIESHVGWMYYAENLNDLFCQTCFQHYAWSQHYTISNLSLGHKQFKSAN